MTAHNITHVRHLGLATPELDMTAGFYRDLWGLTPVLMDRDLVFLAAEGSEEPFVLRLRRATDPRLDVVAFGVESRDDVDWFGERIIGRSLRLLSEPGELEDPCGGYGFRFFDPEGRVIEISSDVAPRFARPIGEHEAIPVALSHAVLNAHDLPSSIRFFVDVMGFRISDWLEDRMCFLRCNQNHHSIALSIGPHVNLNHIAYEMRGIDEYMRATGRLLRAGGEMVWGPGRHGPGMNTFSYFRDATGFVTEFTTELERITDEQSWQPRVFRAVPEESDLWGTANERKADAFEGRPDTGLWVAPPV